MHPTHTQTHTKHTDTHVRAKRLETIMDSIDLDEMIQKLPAFTAQLEKLRVPFLFLHVLRFPPPRPATPQETSDDDCGCELLATK